MAIRSRNIANVNTAGYRAQDVVVSEGRVSSKPSANPVGPETGMNNVDLAKDLVGLKTDERYAGYNLKAIKAQDRMTGTLLDMVG